MHYSFELTVTPANTINNLAIAPAKLGAGIIKHVSISFPYGCYRLVRCAFYDQCSKLLPSNSEGSYCEDGYVVEVDCYIDMRVHGNIFWVAGWSTDDTYTHTIHFLIDVEGVDEPKPEQTIKLLADSINNLVQLMRSWF